MTELVLSGVTRRYGEITAIADLSLELREGEFLTLLGPSGCGKSTTLAAIAGLDRPTAGRIAFRERVLYDGASGVFLPPEARGFGVVFQSYALWPHLTVAANVGMPLKLRRVPKPDLRRRVDEALDLIGLTGLADRYPGELSGGQQQRVALARAIVFRPPLLLLDEPLSNLDAQLRQQARSWLKEIQSGLGLTAVYVTHDQDEALAMSDRIAVMRGGRVVQQGTPQEIYETPTHPFAASFIGSANLMPAAGVARTADGWQARLEDGQVAAASVPGGGDPGEQPLLCFRPQKVGLAPLPGASELAVEFGPAAYLGDRVEQQFRLAGATLRLVAETAVPPGAGRIWLEPRNLLVFPREEAAA